MSAARRVGFAVALLAAASVAPGLLGRPATAEPPTDAAVTLTKEIHRGDRETRTATVSVSEHQNLINRQVVRISWSGFVPSHGLPIGTVPQNASAPNEMEYPVVVMQCVGADPAQQDCYFQRPIARVASRMSYWDALQPPDRQADGYVEPFKAVTRDEPYQMQSGDMPPDIGTNSFAGTTLVEPTGLSGDRTDVRFEIRDQVTTPSLGCSATSECSIVVVPVMDLVCAADADPPCRAGPLAPLGAPNQGVVYNESLTTQAWYLESNWRNRFVVPITIAPPEATCDATDPRPQRALIGAETADLAMRRVGQDLCVDRSAPKIAHVRQSEEVARGSLARANGTEYEADAALVTRPVTNSPRPLVHAPILATGFAVTFAVDVQVSGKAPYELADLRLNPRLLAKLLTQSYKNVGWGNHDHPTIGENPQTLFHDPEFHALNPDYPLLDGQPANNNNAVVAQSLAVVTNDSDAYHELTRYVAADGEAARWLAGEPDEHGTVVNPKYRGTPFPMARFEQRDDWHQEGVPCGALPALTASQHVAPTLHDATYMIADSQGLNQECVNSGTTGNPVWGWAKPNRLYYPNRVYLAVSSVAYARAYGLPTAQLQSGRTADGGRTFVGPTPESMTAALRHTVRDAASGTVLVDHANLPADAYPGTLPVYAAVPTAGLAADVAADYAEFLRRAVDDRRQTLGPGVGQLPDGYAPLPPELRRQTRTLAEVVARQQGAPPAPTPGPSSSPAGTGGGPTGTNPDPAGTASTPTPGTSVPTSATPTPSGSQVVVPRAATRGETSVLGRWALPAVLGTGLLVLLVLPFVLLAAQPDHPLRRLGQSARRLLAR
ncbi:hypothetical protein [Polymorphospora rubra]|uniref:hypothetical protein n=1 Tax=Polymorphospora rubra TaxID=338584 RepID=UPI0033D0D178